MGIPGRGRAMWHRRTLSRWLAIGSASLALLVAVAPATATIFDRTRYSDDYSFSYPCGGATVTVAGHTEGVFIVRTGKGAFATAFYAHDNYAYRETHSSTTGRSLVITGDGLFQETRAIALGGTQFAFSSVNAGQPFTVWSASGEVLVRDRGAIRQTIVFDTLGDGVPGGVFIEDVSFAVAGPHDGLGFDTCSILG